MERIKQFLQLDKPSFLLLTFPYIAFIWNDIYFSTFFTYSKLAILPLIFFFFLGIDFFNRYFKHLDHKIISFLAVFVTTIFISLLYYYSLLIPSVKWFNRQLPNVKIEAKYAIPILLGILLLIQAVCIKSRPRYFTLLNIFFLNFFLVVSIGKIQSNFISNQKNINQVKNSLVEIQQSDQSQKPIILIIADEYHSPDGLFEIYKADSLYTFSNQLKQKGWQVRNSYPTHEIQTIRSLSSLFNFNLSLDSTFSTHNNGVIGSKLITSSLYDSLVSKNCTPYNFGILDFGKTPRFSKLYYLYPRTFNEILLNQFVEERFILYRLLAQQPDSVNEDSHNHNQILLNSLPNRLSKIKEATFFAYVHLLMPHAPFEYPPEFDYQKENLKNYLNYWNFTNKKLTVFLQELVKEDKYRIIFTGDHGFRFDKNKRVDPKNTFAAFWGFEEKDLEYIQSVQDLGSLINGYY